MRQDTRLKELQLKMRFPQSKNPIRCFHFRSGFVNDDDFASIYLGFVNERWRLAIDHETDSLHDDIYLVCKLDVYFLVDLSKRNISII